MLNRIGITLADNTGTEKEVFASRKSAVVVKLQQKIPERLSVLATPMPSFDPDSDFIIALVRENEMTRLETIHGTAPAWALEGAVCVPPGTAVLLASKSNF
ncbi:MAG: hypothetical protein SGJ27_24665 [Candidatus Melainabacteria bacterium]|nr:hypothetical protein [Candidatus Melainabacteria bacterium]